jgi:pterin-4a-carbinolamine dehydratase
MEVPEGWTVIEGALQREFRFKDFSRTQVAQAITDRDAELATQTDGLARG